MTKTYCNKCEERLDHPALTMSWPHTKVHLCAKCTRDLGKWLGVRL